MSDPEKLLPLDAWHRARGARMVPFAGYAMPVQFEGIIAEHRWTRESASLFDVSHMGQLHIGGAQTEGALERVLPADVQLLGDARMRYSMLLNDEGGIVDDLMVTRRGDHFYMVVNGATKAGDIAFLQARLPTLVVDEMKEQALEASRVADLLLDQPEVRPAGLGARDSLRLEAGLPLYGHDLDETISPVEAGLDFAIARRRRAEGGFPGAERIARQMQDGPRMRRVGLAIAGRQPVREDAAIVDQAGERIGKVTSGGFSPTLERPIAMAYVPADLAGTGTRLRVSQRERLFDAEVVPLPFVPHRYQRRT